MESLLNVAIVLGIILAVFMQVWAYIYYTKLKYKETEAKMVENTKILLRRLDAMDEELRRIKKNG